ncbi:MAG: hypothetical protein FWH03_02305 [Firmicutes bacterium]|nr:hypothetical protein [Bacillota bacterium]
MNDCDQVKVIRDRERYAKHGVHKGMTGYIMDPRCVDGKRLVSFSGEFLQAPNGVWYTTDVDCDILEKDLELVSET